MIWGQWKVQLLDTPGLAVRAIDLHALNPRIEQCDFFSLSRGGELDEASGVTVPYDAVVCSMVLNCVPRPQEAQRQGCCSPLAALRTYGNCCFCYCC